MSYRTCAFWLKYVGAAQPCWDAAPPTANVKFPIGKMNNYANNYAVSLEMRTFAAAALGVSLRAGVPDGRIPNKAV